MKDRPEIGERNEEKGRRATTAMCNTDTVVLIMVWVFVLFLQNEIAFYKFTHLISLFGIIIKYCNFLIARRTSGGGNHRQDKISSS